MTNFELKECVINQLEMRFSDLSVGGTYIAEELCGKDFWSFLSSGERKSTGTIISQLVKSNYFDELKPVKWEHEYPLKYKLASTC